jgi:hypothetical protein
MKALNYKAASKVINRKDAGYWLERSVNPSFTHRRQLKEQDKLFKNLAGILVP